MGYIESNFISDQDDSKSVSGLIFTLNGEAICWKSSKQHTIADLAYEVEYIVASDAAKEAVWLRKFIGKLVVAPSLKHLVPLYCDSTGAIAQAKKPRAHQRTKHILWCYHLIREIIDRGDIELLKINRKENLADPFTKAIKIKEFDRYKWKMDIRYCSDWL